MTILKNDILNYLQVLKPELNSHGIVSLGLFGSRAKDTNTSNSDIDIVYETFDDFIEEHKGWSAFTYLNENLRDKVSKKFNTNVDMFDLNSSSTIIEKIRKEAIYV
jgi:predicted nucleotidyltransferase